MTDGLAADLTAMLGTPNHERLFDTARVFGDSIHSSREVKAMIVERLWMGLTSPAPTVRCRRGERRRDLSS